MFAVELTVKPEDELLEKRAKGADGMPEVFLIVILMGAMAEDGTPFDLVSGKVTSLLGPMDG